MRAIHVFPFFGSGLHDGAQHYQFMLSKKLVDLGVDLDVFTTRSSQVRFNSAFSLRWDNDYDCTFERIDNIRVHRFSSITMPAAFGKQISTLMRRRWELEERRCGAMLPGSKNLVDYYYQRACSRPSIYDWITLVGRGPNTPSLLSRLARTAGSYDVILVGFMPFALITQVTRIAKFLGKPIIILALFHPEDNYHHFRSLYRSLSDADAVLTQTSYSTQLMERILPAAEPVCVGAGVDEKASTAEGVSGERFRLKYGLQNHKIMLFVGRKEPAKRYDLALQAIDLINDKRIKLVMIGRDVDAQPIRSQHVIHLGELLRTDLLDAYAACDVFLMPSTHESFGMVFLEAWMRRKPVIGNARCGAVSSLIRHGIDGYLCHTGEEMAEKAAHLITNHSLAERMGEAGYKRTIEQFTWNKVAMRVYELYQAIVAKNSPPV